MNNCHNYQKIHSRRDFLNKLGMGLGGLSLASLINPLGATNSGAQPQVQGLLNGMGSGLHFPARAKRVIYLFQSGGPSQQDLFDYKPELKKRYGEELPESVRQGQRLTGMTSGQGGFPLAGSVFDFKQHGQSGKWLSDRLPYLGQVADDICWINSMHTDAINHDPAVMFFQTGSQFPGRPSIGVSTVEPSPSTHDPGALPFCQVNTRVSNSGQGKTQYYTSTILEVLPRVLAALS